MYFTLIGIGTVFLVLILLQLFIWLFSHGFAPRGKKEEQSGEVVRSAAPSQVAGEDKSMTKAVHSAESSSKSEDTGAPDEATIAALAYAIYRRKLAQGRPPGTDAGHPERTGEWSRRARADQTSRLSSKFGGR